jgi:acetyltransferase-like isoleucine patch superfamily enzyme
MAPSDYKKHTDYDKETNARLDAEWKAYIDHTDNLAKIDIERKKELTGMNQAYDIYNNSVNEAIIKSYGEPFLKFGDKLIVTEGSYVISSALRHNTEFPRSLTVIPEVGEECVISNKIKLWLGTETVVIIKIESEDNGYWTPAWSSHHVPCSLQSNP